MDREINVVVKRIQFWPLILMNNIFHREVMDFEIVSQKLKFVFVGCIEVEP